VTTWSNLSNVGKRIINAFGRATGNNRGPSGVEEMRESCSRLGE
jgi:hypothetical protein